MVLRTEEHQDLAEAQEPDKCRRIKDIKRSARQMKQIYQLDLEESAVSSRPRSLLAVVAVRVFAGPAECRSHKTTILSYLN